MKLKDLENKIFAIDSPSWKDRKIMFGLEYKDNYLKTLMVNDNELIWIANLTFDDFNFVESKVSKPNRFILKCIFEYRWINK